MNMIRPYFATLIFSFIAFAAYSAYAQGPTKTPTPSLPPGAAPIDWTKEQAGVPKGKVDAFVVDDRQYNRKRKIWVYTPPGYDAKSSEPYRLLISFDGEDYIKDIPAPTILDNLIAAGKIHPAIQVMIDNSEDRLGDLANHQKFADFVAKDLLSWAQTKYRVAHEAEKVTLLGYSAGGLAAAYVAFRYPNLFGNVLSQSGAFWRGNEGASAPSEWLTAQFKSSPKSNLRFYIVVGGGETIKNSSGFSMSETSGHLRDTLKSKGYDVAFLEVPGAVHNPESWRMQLADGLIHLIGKK
jgi:enterochelin esterase family protein